MPITVVVRTGSAGKTPPGQGNEPSLTFDGDRIVLGRSNGCDVRLPDPSVSLRHASIRAQGPEFAIVDEGSSNGTWVGGVRLGPHTPRVVRSGDLVRLGRVWLEVIVGQRPATPDLGLATRDLALALVRDAMNAVGDDTRVKVRVTEGPDVGAVLRLVEEGRAYVIGRAEKCDLPLADEDASREHATVVRRGGQVFLVDLGSRNGVYLGETRLVPNRETPWRPPTMARVGVAVLALDEPVSLALAQLEAAADEPLAEKDAPPPPPSIVNPPKASVPDPIPPALPPPNAPVAQVEPDDRGGATYVRPRRKRGWSPADVFVVSVAIVVISASIASLVWVLR